MRMRSLRVLFVALTLAAGCATRQVPDRSEARYVPRDKGAARSVALTRVQERITDDGRLEVVARLKNKLNRRIDVQVDCVFKNEDGIPLNENSSFQTLTLTGNAVGVVHFTSRTSRARNYAVRVRQRR